MRRHSSVEPRRVIFIGVEGESERAFVRFLQRCCRDEGLHLSVRIKLTRGGDSVSVVEEAGRHLARREERREIESRLVLLDRDRVEEIGKPVVMRRPLRPSGICSLSISVRNTRGFC